MLDIKLIRENPEFVRENFKKRKNPKNLERLEKVIAADIKWRDLKKQVDNFGEEVKILPTVPIPFYIGPILSEIALNVYGGFKTDISANGELSYKCSATGDIKVGAEYTNTDNSEWIFRAKDHGYVAGIIEDVLLFRRIHENNISSDVNQQVRSLLKVVSSSIRRQKENE